MAGSTDGYLVVADLLLPIVREEVCLLTALHPMVVGGDCPRRQLPVDAQMGCIADSDFPPPLVTSLSRVVVFIIRRPVVIGQSPVGLGVVLHLLIGIGEAEAVP